MTGGDKYGPIIDTDRPQVARLRSFLLGEKNFYSVDREFAVGLLIKDPGADVAVRASRWFHDVATTALAESGVDQFLDLAAGFEPRVYRQAVKVHPDARVAYVDDDPVVLAHLRAHEPESQWVAASPTDIGAILAGAKLDWTRPVAVSAIGAVEYIDDQAATVAAMHELFAALAPGSALVMCTPTPDRNPDQALAARQVYASISDIRYRPRTLEEFREHFGGLVLDDQGIVAPDRWRSPIEPLIKRPEMDVSSYAAVGRKP